MFKSAEISQLQTRITELEASLATGTEGKAAIEAQLATAQAALAKAETTIGTHAAAITAHEATITGLNTKVTTAEAAVTAAEARAVAAEASINAQVTARLAAAGVDPIARAPGVAEQQDGKPKADASLPPRQRAAAAMAGWKVFGKN